ncbi:MAG: sigma-70 family RNA polymerase sigma factor [Planctomycetota bacterium]
MATTNVDRTTDTAGASRTSRSLILRAGQNDSDAWERLVRLYSPMVYYWCRKSGLPEPDLHDVFQEVFHTLARSINKFRPVKNGTFRGWLRTMTRNKLIDHFRKSDREPRPIGGTEALRFLEQYPANAYRNAMQSTGRTQESLSDGNANGEVFDESRPEESVLQHRLLRQALKNVRENFAGQTWKAFWMVVIDGRETADVARDLDMRPGTVRVAKSRVLKRLRLELGDAIE